jgi:hypothetical protein
MLLIIILTWLDRNYSKQCANLLPGLINLVLKLNASNEIICFVGGEVSERKQRLAAESNNPPFTGG